MLMMATTSNFFSLSCLTVTLMDLGVQNHDPNAAKTENATDIAGNRESDKWIHNEQPYLISK